VSVTTVSTGDSISASGPARFNPPHPTSQIDYKKMGIEDPEQKSSFPLLLVAALIGGLIVLAAVFLLRGHL